MEIIGITLLLAAAGVAIYLAFILLDRGTLWFDRHFNKPLVTYGYTRPNPLLNVVRIPVSRVRPVACVEDTAVYPSEAPTDPQWPMRSI